ncbi:MAG: hypothetical protein ACPGVB_00685 [Chitinophagales bacterium]
MGRLIQEELAQTTAVLATIGKFYFLHLSHSRAIFRHTLRWI